MSRKNLATLIERGPSSAVTGSGNETLSELIERFRRSKRIADIVAAAGSVVLPPPPKDERDSWRILLKDFFRTSNHKDAVAISLALLVGYGDDFVALLRKHGLLRASRYDYKIKCVAVTVSAMRKVGSLRGLSAESLMYLDSVAALHTLVSEVARLHHRIVANLNARKTVVVKTALAIVNQSFSHRTMFGSPAPTAMEYALSPEELAEAFSTLLDLYRKNIGWPGTWKHADDDVGVGLNKFYEALFTDTFRLNEYTNAEVLLDGLPYQAAVTSSGEVRVSSIDPAFERSVRLGYVQMDQQMMIRGVHLASCAKKDGPPSLREWVEKAFEVGMSDHFAVLNSPRRVVFGFDFEGPIGDLLKTNNYLVEELAAIATLDADTFDSAHPAQTRLTANLTIHDVLKGQRVFALISHGFARKFEELDKHERALLTIRSVIPVFQYTKLIEFLGQVMSMGAARDFVELLTLRENPGHIELQYTPFILTGEWVAVAPAVVAMSNLVRNLVRGNGLKPVEPPLSDLMQSAVVKALRQAGFLAGVEVIPKVQGSPETDIIAWKDEHLFLFECKSAYHPCTSHELRNSYWHIDKGARQLDKRKHALADAKAQAKLFKQLEWNVKPGVPTHTCVITSNRMFNGYEMGGHPVRQARELINVVSMGMVRNNNGDESFWKGEKFHVDDLIDYLNGLSIIQRQNQAMKPWHRSLAFESKLLTLESFRQDIDALIPTVRQ